MQSEEFNDIVINQSQQSIDLLLDKNAAYNPNEDKLHNFKVAAKLQGVSYRQALAGMMAKHTTSVYDLCRAEEIETDMDIWNEKITDSINYLLLLKAVVQEEMSEFPQTKSLEEVANHNWAAGVEIPRMSGIVDLNTDSQE